MALQNGKRGNTPSAMYNVLTFQVWPLSYLRYLFGGLVMSVVLLFKWLWRLLHRSIMQWPMVGCLIMGSFWFLIYIHAKCLTTWNQGHYFMGGFFPEVARKYGATFITRPSLGNDALNDLALSFEDIVHDIQRIDTALENCFVDPLPYALGLPEGIRTILDGLVIVFGFTVCILGVLSRLFGTSSRGSQRLHHMITWVAFIAYIFLIIIAVETVYFAVGFTILTMLRSKVYILETLNVPGEEYYTDEISMFLGNVALNSRNQSVLWRQFAWPRRFWLALTFGLLFQFLTIKLFADAFYYSFASASIKRDGLTHFILDTPRFYRDFCQQMRNHGVMKTGYLRKYPAFDRGQCEQLVRWWQVSGLGKTPCEAAASLKADIGTTYGTNNNQR